MEDRTMGRYSTMVAKQRKQLRRMSKYLRVYLQDEVWGWAQLVNGGWNGDAIKEGGWGRRQCGGMYGVSARQNLSGVVGWTYSVGDADAWRCPLTSIPPSREWWPGTTGNGKGLKAIALKSMSRMSQGAPGCFRWNSETRSGAWMLSQGSQELCSIPNPSHLTR